MVEFLKEDEEGEEGGTFISIHYDWLKFLQSGECTPHLYMDAAAWEASGDPAHPDFEPPEEDEGPGPGLIVGAQVEQTGENPFLSHQSSAYLPSGRVRVFFPNAKEGDTQLRDRQKADVERFAKLRSSDASERAGGPSAAWSVWAASAVGARPSWCKPPPPSA